MHDSINHGITVTLFYTSKINKTPKILFLEFLRYFTTKTGGRKKKKRERRKHLEASCLKQQRKIHLRYILSSNKSNGAFTQKNPKPTKNAQTSISLACFISEKTNLQYLTIQTAL